MFKCIVLLLGLTSGLLSQHLKMVGEIKIDPKDDRLINLYCFTVMESGNFLFADSKFTEFKIISNEGKFIRSFGRKGIGPEGFVKPINLSKCRNRYGLIDFTRRHFCILEEDEGHKLKVVRKEFVNMAYGCSLMNGKEVILDAYYKGDDGNHYMLYKKNLETGKIVPLMKDYQKFGVASKKEYEENRKEKFDPLNFQSFQAFYGGYVYYTWSGNLRLMRIKADGSETRVFGKKTSNYRPPETAYLGKLMRFRKIKRWVAERRKFSAVDTLLPFKDGILVSYHHTIDGNRTSFIQYYSKDLKFINEFKLDHMEIYPGINFIDHENGAFYFLSKKTTEDNEELISIKKFIFVSSPE